MNGYDMNFNEHFYQAPYVYVQLFHLNGNEKNVFIAMKVKLLNLPHRSLIKNAHFRRTFKIALRGFCIWTLHIYMKLYIIIYILS